MWGVDRKWLQTKSHIFVGDGTVNNISPSRLFDPPCHNFRGYLPPGEGVHGFYESETNMPHFF
jgi:hypothetical protein